MKLIHYFERRAKGKIVQELEGLRFLAIVPVVVQHCVERWYRNAYTEGNSHIADVLVNYCLGGGVGVYLFFAISGFILPLPFAVKRLSGQPMGSMKNYFMRRLTRLEPPYILIMLVLAIIAVALHKMTTIAIIKYFFAGITYTSTLIFKQFNPLNPVIWSLEVEIQFYIIAPLITWLIFGIRDFNRRNLVIVLSIFAIVAMQEITGISSATTVWRFTILGQLHYFMTGILMVNLYLQHKLQPKGQVRVWDIAAPLALFGMIAFRWVTGFVTTLSFVIVLAILFAGAFRSGAFNRFLKRPWIMATGGMCYSIYLLHLAVAQACMELLLKLRPGIANSVAWFTVYALFFLACLVLIVPIFYLLIEKPCMDHSWPTRLRNYILAKTGRAVVINKAGTAGEESNRA